MRLRVDRRIGGQERLSLVDDYDLPVQIPPEIADCVAFVLRQPRGTSAQSCRVLTGTAFFVAVEARADGEAIYLVTAKHVLDAIKEDTHDGIVWVRLNSGGQAKEVGLKIALWKQHPTDPLVDAVAVEWPQQLMGFDYRAIQSTIAACDKVSVEAGQGVMMTGLFSNHAGAKRNLPIVRLGSIALVPEDKVQSKHGPIDAYLIEARSIGGLSGSPAFVLTKWDHDGIPVPFEGSFFWLGLIHGHWDIDKVDGDAVAVDARGMTINMGIAIVVPAKKVQEVLDQDDFKRVRDARAEQVRKSRLPTMDVADTPARGPEPDRLKLEGPFEDRVRDSFKAGPAPKSGKKPKP